MKRRLKMQITLELDLVVETTDCYGKEREDTEIVSSVEIDVDAELRDHLMYGVESLEPSDVVQEIKDLSTDVTVAAFIDEPVTV